MTAQEFKLFMSRHNLSVDDVCAICKVSRDTVYGYRCGRRKPSKLAIYVLGEYVRKRGSSYESDKK